MKTRWIISIIVSLLIHTAVLYGMYFQQSQKPAPAIPMQVEIAPGDDPQPEHTAEQQPPAEPKPEDLDDEQPEQEELKFRPTEEIDIDEPHADDPFQAAEDSSSDQQQPTDDTADPPDDRELPADTADASAATPQTAEEYRQEIQQYRSRIVDAFDDNWRQIPELNTRIPHPSMVAAIDKHFGITVLAYGFVDHRPAPPFLVFDPDTGTFTKTDAFDFSRYSNRIKDRSFDAAGQNALQRARREYGLSSFMKVIGLVPIEADRYFAAKQYQAARLAEVPLERVALTSGHYEPDKSGGFSLIIDTVTTVDNRRIAVQDEEKRYSDPSKR